MTTAKNGSKDDRCGAKRISDERQRQIEKEGWTDDHDDEHEDRSLVAAAVCYAMPGEAYKFVQLDNGASYFDPWPESWNDEWDKRLYHKNGDLKKMDELPRKQQIRMLEKAGALIAAEIDRLLRIENGTSTHPERDEDP